MPNELDDTLRTIRAIEEQRQDHAEQSLRERRLEELTKDEVQCGACDRRYPLAEDRICDQCFRGFCRNCLWPAVDPVNGEKLPFVCPSCREEIKQIEEGRSLLRHKDMMADCIEETLAFTNNEQNDVHARLGMAEGSLKALRDVYGIRKVG